MANYVKTAVALALLAMLGTSPVLANRTSSATRIENGSVNDELPKLAVSFAQCTYRYNTDNYATFQQPVPTGSAEGETPTITSTNEEVATVSGGTVTLTGKTGIAGIIYIYPETAGHAQAKSIYPVIVTAAEPTLVGTASQWQAAADNCCADIKLTASGTQPQIKAVDDEWADEDEEVL